MKKTVLTLILGFLLIGTLSVLAVNAYAAGDLIVEGNLGVGTTAPATTLDVKGTITLPDNETIENTAEKIIFRSSVNSNRRFVVDLSNIWRAGLYGYGDDGISRLFFGSPVQIGNDVVLIFGNSTPSGISWRTQQGAGKHYMRFGTELGGANNASGYFMFTEEYDNPVISAPASNPTIRLASTDDTKYMDFWHDQTNANINWNTGSLILTGGNVGIGTTAPNSKLEVNGGDVRVTGGSFIDDGTALNAPDYVFDARYNLKPLHEVEKFVLQNKHLEGFPAMRDIAGWARLTMQDRDMKLLEKIEELTLHIIEQQKIIEKLKAEVAQIKTK